MIAVFLALSLATDAFAGYRVISRAPLCAKYLRSLGIPDTSAALIPVPESASELGDRVAKALEAHPLPIDGKPAVICTYGSCDPSSDNLQQILRGKGFATQRFKVRHTSNLKIGGLPVPIPSVHYFLSATSGSGEQVIIDSTYLQFLRKDARQWLSPIFIGTRADLIDFCTVYSHELTLSGVDLEEFVDQTWGFGQYAQHRKLQQGYEELE
jgi:hypothetical protein